MKYVTPEALVADYKAIYGNPGELAPGHFAKYVKKWINHPAWFYK